LSECSTCTVLTFCIDWCSFEQLFKDINPDRQFANMFLALLPFKRLRLSRPWAKARALLMPLVRSRLEWWWMRARLVVAESGADALWFFPETQIDLSLVECIYESQGIRHLEPLALQRELLNIKMDEATALRVMNSVSRLLGVRTAFEIERSEPLAVCRSGASALPRSPTRTLEPAG
jgi:hypothetical protein